MTKIAVVTDLHANREAVEAVFAHARAQGATEWAFLGDFVGYGADPAWVVDQVREMVEAGAAAVCGNHDEAAVIGSTPQMRTEARMVIDWTRAQLDPGQLDFLAALPFQVQREDRLYVHANAFAPSQWEYVQGRADAVRSIHATTCHYTFCGHVHEPALYHLGATGKAGDFKPTPEVPIPLPGYRQWLVIPGSAGQPRDGNPAACYAMFEPAAQRDHLSPCTLRPRERRRQDPRGGPARAAGGATRRRDLSVTKPPEEVEDAAAAIGHRAFQRRVQLRRRRRHARRRATGTTSAAWRPPLEKGAIVDGFLLEKRLHQGGMASMWRVSRVDAEGKPAPVADEPPLIMKVPRIKGGEDPATIVGYEVEQMIMPALTGQHVPRYVARGDFTRQPFIVMEHIAGDTLRPRLAEAPLALDEVAEIGIRVATALHDLHRQHVVHLDIKPSNIMFRPDGAAVLVDYGLSRHEHLPDLLEEEFSLPMGTGPYMSPEQVQFIRNDPRSDLFALGVMLYHFTTGERPFGAPTLGARPAQAAVDRPGAAARAAPRLPAVAAGGHPQVPRGAARQALPDRRAARARPAAARPDRADAARRAHGALEPVDAPEALVLRARRRAAGGRADGHRSAQPQQHHHGRGRRRQRRRPNCSTSCARRCAASCSPSPARGSPASA